MLCTFLQAIKESKQLDLSPDFLMVRSRHDPTKWPLDADGEDPSLTTTVLHSNLHADVPEFIPGQKYTFPTQGMS